MLGTYLESREKEYMYTYYLYISLIYDKIPASRRFHELFPMYCTGLLSLGMPGVKILADQLTLCQPVQEGQIMPTK